jgi:hypothetical protein
VFPKWSAGPPASASGTSTGREESDKRDRTALPDRATRCAGAGELGRVSEVAGFDDAPIIDVHQKQRLSDEGPAKVTQFARQHQ